MLYICKDNISVSMALAYSLVKWAEKHGAEDFLLPPDLPVSILLYIYMDNNLRPFVMPFLLRKE